MQPSAKQAVSQSRLTRHLTGSASVVDTTKACDGSDSSGKRAADGNAVHGQEAEIDMQDSDESAENAGVNSQSDAACGPAASVANSDRQSLGTAVHVRDEAQANTDSSAATAPAGSMFHADSLKSLQRRTVAKKRKNISHSADDSDSAVSSCDVATMTFVEPHTNTAAISVADQVKKQRQQSSLAYQ